MNYGPRPRYPPLPNCCLTLCRYVYKDKYINVLEIRTWCIDTPYTIPNPLTCYEKNVCKRAHVSVELVSCHIHPFCFTGGRSCWRCWAGLRRRYDFHRERSWKELCWWREQCWQWHGIELNIHWKHHFYGDLSQLVSSQWWHGSSWEP